MRSTGEDEATGRGGVNCSQQAGGDRRGLGRVSRLDSQDVSDMRTLMQVEHDASREHCGFRLFVADGAQDDLLAVEVEGELMVAHGRLGLSWDALGRSYGSVPLMRVPFAAMLMLFQG